MQTKEHKNNHQIVDYSAILEKKYGKIGTPERIASEEKALAFFTGKIIEQARKESKMTQSELAEKLGTNKSYISRVETGVTEPKVSTFYRIASALGLSVELT
jgi:ribosome-binding protein aMBF1 (putative translation factor)